jgi:ketosteroid isomerase-like protein
VRVSEQNLDVARRAFEAFADRDLTALVANMAGDVEFLPVTANIATGGMPYRGHDGIRQYLEDVGRLWQELRVFPEEIRALSDSVVVALGRIHARGGGMILDRPTGWVWVMRDGKIVSGRVCATHEEALDAAAELVRRSEKRGD